MGNVYCTGYFGPLITKINYEGEIEWQLADEENTIYQISGLFKIKSELLFEEPQIQNIIKESNARIVTVNKEFFVIEKSGRKEEIELLYRELKPFGILQFTRSGRISVSKQPMKISEMLEAFNQ